MKTRYIPALVCVVLLSSTLLTQTPSKVEFGRDVQPILRDRCYSCHGAPRQEQGLRLDRRRFAMPNRVGANRASIVPGNSAISPLYLKLIGRQPGLQMPPDAPLDPAQIDRIKTWIDEGADWPDQFSGEVPESTPDPTAVQIMDALRNGERSRFLKMLRENPGVWNAKGKSGSTPLMYAALYGDVESLKLLLDRGADPNARNDAKATALMYAIDDVEKTRLLLTRGADPNARSDDGQTPLLLAVARPGAIPVVRLLLDHGANPSVSAPAAAGPTTPLLWAAINADADLMKLLLDRGAAKTPSPLGLAVRSECGACVDLAMAFAGQSDLDEALPQAVRAGDPAGVTRLLDRGARPGGSVLTALAQSPVEFPSVLIERLIRAGADINANTALGPVLHLARLQGDTSLVRALSTAGARSDVTIPASISPRPHSAQSVRAAIERSLPLIDRADVAFISRSGCISCHNNSLAPMVRAAVRKSGIPVNERIASSQREAILGILAGNRERVLQVLGLPGRQDTAGYILLGLAAENHPADEITDAWARYLKNLQQTDGRWRVQAQRPPIESSDIQVTAAALRAIQIYAPGTNRNEYQKAVQLAARWLAQADPKTTEDRVFLILGLHWGRARQEVIRRVAKELLSRQRSDGGWAQIPTLPGDAYATGQVLFALSESGSLKPADPAYQRGVKFLLDSQLEDGSWHVRTRTLPVQRQFDSDFPHGTDQFISAAATNWATMALAGAAR